MTFAIFHDFPGQENGLPKFHDQGAPCRVHVIFLAGLMHVVITVITVLEWLVLVFVVQSWLTRLVETATLHVQHAMTVHGTSATECWNTFTFNSYLTDNIVLARGSLWVLSMATWHYYNTRIMASFWEPVPDCQTTLDSAAARDDSDGPQDYRNLKRAHRLHRAPVRSYQQHTNIRSTNRPDALSATHPNRQSQLTFTWNCRSSAVPLMQLVWRHTGCLLRVFHENFRCSVARRSSPWCLLSRPAT